MIKRTRKKKEKLKLTMNKFKVLKEKYLSNIFPQLFLEFHLAMDLSHSDRIAKYKLTYMISFSKQFKKLISSFMA